MKFIILSIGNKDSELAAAELDRYEAGALPPGEEFVKMLAYQEELVKAGVLVGGEGLRPTSLGARLTFGHGGKTTIVDGPFAEAKEVVIGFAILNVKSREEAIAWTRRAPYPPGTTVELRQLFTDDDFASVDPTGDLREQDAKLREQAEQQHAPR